MIGKDNHFIINHQNIKEKKQKKKWKNPLG